MTATRRTVPIGAPANPATVDDLSTRELEIIRLITHGLSNQEIVETVYLGMNTVKTYIRGAYRKIGVTTRTQAVLWGIHHDLLDGYTIVRRPREEPATLRAV